MSAEPVRAVLFDAYGTLCHIADQRRPYQQLAKRVTNRVLFTKAVMTQPLSLRAGACSPAPGGASSRRQRERTSAVSLGDRVAGGAR